MKLIDEIDNINDLIIELRAQLNKDTFNKDLLIREAFTLWYVLVEGVVCENFTDNEIESFLRNNFKIYQTHYSKDSDYTFIVGWMVGLTFWYFDPSVKKEDGNQLLLSAYKHNSKNSLFKWAVRNEVNLTDDEVNNLKIDIVLRFEQLFNYGTLVKEYFLDIINTSHPGLSI